MMKFDCKVRIEGHTDELSRLIKDRVPFRLGARGICCDCTPTVHNEKSKAQWEVRIPRAHMVVVCNDIAVFDDGDEIRVLDVTFDGKTWNVCLDLTKYEVFSYGVRCRCEVVEI